MILDELRQEAERRASSPAGLQALVRTIMTQFEQDPATLEQSLCASDFFRAEEREVRFVQFGFTVPSGGAWHAD